MNKSKFETEQEEFWAGDFGLEYLDRNKSVEFLASNINFFSKSLRSAISINSCIEFGCNIGMQLKALKYLYPKMQLHGIEINSDAAEKLANVIDKKNIYNQSIFDYECKKVFDLVLIKGVLIHIRPERLP